jgi:hypothetical protein
MNATEITPRMVLAHLSSIAEKDGRIDNRNAHWDYAAKIGLSDRRIFSMVSKLKRLGYLEDRVVLVAHGTTHVWTFVTGKQSPVYT